MRSMSSATASSSVSSGGEEHKQDSNSAEAHNFQDLFKAEFLRLVNEGCPKNEAASKALLAAQALMRESSVKSTAEPSAATSESHVECGTSGSSSCLSSNSFSNGGTALPPQPPPNETANSTTAETVAAAVIDHGIKSISSGESSRVEEALQMSDTGVEGIKKKDMVTNDDSGHEVKLVDDKDHDKEDPLPTPPISLEFMKTLLHPLMRSSEMDVDVDSNEDSANEHRKRKMSIDGENDVSNDSINTNTKNSAMTSAIKLIGTAFSSRAVLNASFTPLESNDDKNADVDLVVAQTGCARDKAEALLKKNNNDIVSTVLEVTDEVMDIDDKKLQEDDANENKSVGVSPSQTMQDSSSCSVTICIRDVLDISEVHRTYEVLTSSSEEVQNALLSSLENLAINMPFDAGQCISNGDIKYILIAFEYPELDDPKCTILMKNILTSLEKLPVSLRESISYWLGSMNDEDRYWRYLRNIRQYMTLRMYQGAIDDARSAARALDILYKVLSLYPNIPYTEFYNDALNEDYMSVGDGMKYEIKLWRKYDLKIDNKSKTENLRSFISFPFTLSPAIKADILEEDAQIQMREGYHREMQMAIFTGQRMFLPYLVLHVRRDFILQDTMAIIEHGYEGSDFKKPLKIIFDGEDGVDAGGVRKEFFQVITRQLMDPSYGMFKYHEESRLLYLNADSFDSSQEFELIGVLLGVAIYNSIILDLKMPRCIYKKLKGISLDICDLEELNPSLAHGLQALLNFEGDVKETFATTFQITFERYGEMVTVDLKDNGGDILVDELNRQEYVDLYINYILNSSVQTQFESFNKGFQRVCGGSALDLFEAGELELLM